MTPLGKFEQMVGRTPIDIRRYRADMIGCRLRIHPWKWLEPYYDNERMFPMSSEHYPAIGLLKRSQIDKAKLALQNWLARFVQHTEDSLSGPVQDLTVQHLSDGWYVVAVVHAFRDVHPDDRDRLRQMLNNPSAHQRLYPEVSILARSPQTINQNGGPRP